MLSCEEAINVLSAYYDGALGAAAQQQVEEHLASCASCREKLAQLKALSTMFDALVFPAADETFERTLHARLEAEAKKKRGSAAWRDIRTYVSIAACLVLVIGAYAATNQRSVLPEPTAPMTTSNREADTTDAAQPKETEAPRTKQILTDTAATVRPSAIPQEEQKGRETAAEEPGGKLPVSETEAEPKPNAAPQKGDSTLAQTPVLGEPQATTVPSDENSEPPYAAAAATPANAEVSSGGASQSVITTFLPADQSVYDAATELLDRFGTVTVSEKGSTVKLLRTNYQACLLTLRSVSGLKEISTASVAESEEQYCYIQIDAVK